LHTVSLAGRRSLWYGESVRNLLLFIALWAGFAVTAQAQTAPAVKPAPLPAKQLNNDPVGTNHGLRIFPTNARRGALEGGRPYPFVRLNDYEVRLPPGAVIFDANNRTIVHGSLPARADVLFLADFTGQVSRIWILSAEERRRFEPWER